MTRITRFDEELLAKARQFLAAADANEASRAILEQYGFTEGERERGRDLTAKTERSFEWERSGQAWNFLSPTPARRAAEARHWFKDARRRHVRSCLRAAEQSKSLGEVLGAIRRALSITTYLAHRAELKRNLERSQGERPVDAPPPKDTNLVELSGWYERWRLLAQRVFRGRPDLMAPYGLVPGKAPPRLRGKLAQLRYGEGAAGRQGPAPAVELEDDDENDDDLKAGAS
jgi:hypothetical protein